MTRLEDEVQRIIGGMDNEQNDQELPETTEQEQKPVYTVHRHYFPDAIVEIYPLHPLQAEEQPQVVDSEQAESPQPPPQPFAYVALSLVLVCCLPMLASILLQVYLLSNPPIATITIMPKTQRVTLKGTLQLGRVLNPITTSQALTVPTTGHGHQDARAATGSLTFYNGQLTSIFVPAGTLLTGSDGVQIITDQDANIPAANLPQVGQATLSAHAVHAGTQGNIAAFDINQGCCAPAIKAVNLAAFSGGQDERDFSTVSKQDINQLSTSLKTTLAQSLSGVFHGQVQPYEQLYLLPCTPTAISDHQPGQEAIQVTVTVSERCTGIAYDAQTLENKVTALLTTQARTTLGTGYSPFGQVQVSVKQAAITHTPTPQVFLTFHAQGTWVYGLSRQVQEQITHLLVGKTTQQAVQLLASLPGVEQAAIRFTGFGDETRLPKQSNLIHLVFIVM